MKKNLFLAAILLLANVTMAQHYEVKQSNYSNVTISFSTPQPSIIETSLMKERYSSIRLDGFTPQSNAGQPALPCMVKIIEVPLGEGLSYTIDNMTVDTISGEAIGINNPIVPAQPSRRKRDLSPITVVKDDATYGRDALYGAQAIEIEAIGIARDRNLARITFNPIRWNPVTNQVTIIKNLTVSVRQHNADIAATQQMKRIHSNPAFNSGVEVINSIGSKDNHTNAPLRYTIVAHSSFRGALDEFVAWKQRKGFIVDIVYTDEDYVGSSTTSIKNYLQSLYVNATAESPAPTYVLFVGDVAQIPAFNMTAYGETQSSDLSYCCWTANDYIPDCYYGRFSAQNLSQLTPQISKTLMYEQYTFPDPTYLSTAALIAGVDGGYSGDNAYKYGDPAMDYVAKLYVTHANGFNNIVYYKNNTSFAPAGVTVTGSSQDNATATALRNLYNNGCGWVNYTAHGSETSWGDPSFTTSNASQMTNNNKPIVMIGNCCLSNSFQVDACLGEALLRKGNNAGAVSYIGGSNSTYWTEDFYWSVGVRTNISNTMNTDYNSSHLGMYDQLFHSHNEPYSNWFTTMGSMIYAGNMAVESSSSNSGMKEYYWQIYHLMGDPSLMPYIHGEAATLTANIPGAVSVGITSLNISTVPYAYIAFNDLNNNLVGAAFADQNGDATLNFAPVSAPGTYEVVITAQGYQPLIQNVNVIANGPFVNVATMTPTTTLEANGDISFDVVLTNLGVDIANNLSIEFQSVDGNLLIDTTGIINLGTSLQQNAEMTLTSVCSAHIWGNTPDGTSTPIKVIVRWGNTVNDMSASTFRFNVNAPKLRMQSYNMVNNFANGGGATLAVSYRNEGHATLQNASISLISLDPGIDVDDANSQVNNLAAGSPITNIYTLVANGDVPENRTVPVIQTICDGFTTICDTIKLLFGQDNSLITFEDNSWGNFDWTQGSYPWEITNQNAYAGTYCARSRTWSTSQWGSNTGNNTQSELSITWTSTKNDSISFYKNVSSENNYDFFRFYIDGVQKEELSGTDNEWSRSAYYVPAGTHTFKFSYEKDYSQRSGSDCAWIDNIHLPLNGQALYYILDSICQGSDYEFNGNTISTVGLAEGIHHFSDTNDDAVYFLTLVLTSAPEVTISGGSVTIRAGETVRLTALGAEKYLWNSGETTPIIDVYPTETTTYTVTGFNGNCSSTASTTITVEGTIGIDEINTHNIRLYPNPASSQINVEGIGMIRVTITDIMGRTVIDIPANGDKLSINVGSLPKGVYFLQTRGDNGDSTTHKFVKK